MMGGVFVAGTDTGVGKTVVAAALAVALRRAGADVGVMKPIATGGIPSEDALVLMRAAGVSDPISDVNPICFQEPVAPMVASELSGRKVELEDVWAAMASLRRRHPFIIVEGIGGVMVPITHGFFVTDLIRQVGYPVIVVGRASLGTINHTLLTVESLRVKGSQVAGVVLNGFDSECPTPSERTNAGVIERLSGVRVLGVLPIVKLGFESFEQWHGLPARGISRPGWPCHKVAEVLADSMGRIAEEILGV